MPVTNSVPAAVKYYAVGHSLKIIVIILVSDQMWNTATISPLGPE